jgi:EKC/KEOPS complex subunit PCC1/LAGE3
MANEPPKSQEQFPYKLYVPPCHPPPTPKIQLTQGNSTLHVPFPTPHLALTSLRALSVDTELSPLVHRSFSIPQNDPSSPPSDHILQVEYSATTNRMLRVAVNGFLESVGVVVGVMRELDTDVVERSMDGEADLSGVQGLAPVAKVDQLPEVGQVEVEG